MSAASSSRNHGQRQYSHNNISCSWPDTRTEQRSIHLRTRAWTDHSYKESGYTTRAQLSGLDSDDLSYRPQSNGSKG